MFALCSLQSLKTKRDEYEALKVELTNNLDRIKEINDELFDRIKHPDKPTADVKADLVDEKNGLGKRNDQIIADKATLSAEIGRLEGTFSLVYFFPVLVHNLIHIARTCRRERQDPLSEYQAFLWKVFVPSSYWNNRDSLGDLHRDPATLSGVHLSLVSDEQTALMNKFGALHIYTKDDKKE